MSPGNKRRKQGSCFIWHRWLETPYVWISTKVWEQLIRVTIKYFQAWMKMKQEAFLPRRYWILFLAFRCSLAEYRNNLFDLMVEQKLFWFIESWTPLYQFCIFYFSLSPEQDRYFYSLMEMTFHIGPGHKRSFCCSLRVITRYLKARDSKSL